MITSFRQLLKRTTPVYLSTGYTDVAGVGALIDPFLVGTAVITSGPIAGPSYGCSDYISFIGSCYCFSRGSVRLKIKREYTPTSTVPYIQATVSKTVLSIV